MTKNGKWKDFAVIYIYRMMKKISKTHENDSDDEDRNPKLLFMMKEPPTLEEIISDLKLVKR